jgi:hypothetical protein
MARTGDIDHVQVMGFDDTIEVHVDEVETGRCPPMAKQPRFNMRKREWLGEKRIIEQIDPPHGEVIRVPPIRIKRVPFSVG